VKGIAGIDVISVVPLNKMATTHASFVTGPCTNGLCGSTPHSTIDSLLDPESARRYEFAGAKILAGFQAVLRLATGFLERWF
jgi:hypothetical protein